LNVYGCGERHLLSEGFALANIRLLMGHERKRARDINTWRNKAMEEADLAKNGLTRREFPHQALGKGKWYHCV
jgi:hypothetical protein